MRQSAGEDVQSHIPVSAHHKSAMRANMYSDRYTFRNPGTAALKVITPSVLRGFPKFYDIATVCFAIVNTLLVPANRAWRSQFFVHLCVPPIYYCIWWYNNITKVNYQLGEYSNKLTNYITIKSSLFDLPNWACPISFKQIAICISRKIIFNEL